MKRQATFETVGRLAIVKAGKASLPPLPGLGEWVSQSEARRYLQVVKNAAAIESTKGQAALFTGTFHNDYPIPKDREQANREVHAFLSMARRREKGLAYAGLVLASGERGRLHLHMIIPAAAQESVIASWGERGKADVQVTDGGYKHGFLPLASYVAIEQRPPIWEKAVRMRTSTGLARPTVKGYSTMAEAMQAAGAAYWWIDTDSYKVGLMEVKQRDL